MRFTTKHIFAAVTIIALAVISFFNLFCGQSSTQSVAQSPYLNHHDSVKYVGMDACRACHNQIYETFIQTGMGQSFNVASKQKSAANFGGHQVVFDKLNNLNYYPYWRNDTMYILEYRLQGKDTIHQRTERVDYIIGSGQHTNSHLMNVNGYIYQMPLTWYAQKKKWDLPPGFENGQNARFSRAIGVECMSCHNAMPVFDNSSANKFVSIPKGIDCERCHGPGELHVKEKAQGNLVDTSTQIDYTIVNPKKLPMDLQIDVCQRCHLQGNAVLKNNKTFTDFRPGMHLGDFIDIYMPKYKGGEEEFIMASHAQRLQMSKCFETAQHTNKLTCITCHNPHVSVKVTGTQVYNKSCNTCHTSQQKNACTAASSMLTAAQNNCVKCHMPKSGTIDIPHVTVTDHYIRKPASTQAKKTLKEFVGIYCINNKNSDNETRGKAYVAYVEKFSASNQNLDSAHFYLSQYASSNTDALIHLLYTKQDFAGVLKQAAALKPNTENSAWLCYRIGRSYFVNTNYNLAKAWYKRAVEIAANNLDFMNALGAAYIELNEFEKAQEVLDNSIAKNNKQPEPYSNLGYLYAKQMQFEAAINFYNKALALDPDFEQALVNKAAVLNVMGKKAEAQRLIQQVLKRNPNSVLAKQANQVFSN